MKKKKDSMSDMSADQKAEMLRTQVKGLKRTRDAYTKDMAISDRDDNKFDMKSGPFERMMKGSAARKASSGIIDRERTIARLESREDRSARSAKYRLAKTKAEKKVKARMGKKDPDAQPGFRPRRIVTPAKKKGGK
jgi:hypothetical protein